MERSTSVAVGLDIRSVVKGYYEAAVARDIMKLAEAFSDDVIWHQSGGSSMSKTYRGKGQLFEMFMTFDSLSEGSFRVDSVDAIMTNGDLVCAVVHYSAERSGDRLSLLGVNLMRVGGGKIKEVWTFSSDQESEDRFWGP